MDLDHECKPCKSNSYIIVIDSRVGITPNADPSTWQFRGNAKLQRRLENIVAFRVRSFHLTSSNTSIITVISSDNAAKLLSNRLGGKIISNPYQLGVSVDTGLAAFPVNGTAQTVIPQSNMIGLRLVPTILAETGWTPLADINPLLRFITPQIIEDFDWQIAPINDLPVAVTTVSFIHANITIEFFPQCTCKC